MNKMTEGGVESSENRTCGICKETARFHKPLPCNHLFCNGCLEQHIEQNAKEGTYDCPVCSEIFVVSADGEENNGPTCDACKHPLGQNSRPAHFCEECEETYCENCTHAHRGSKATRSHVLSQIGKQEEEKGSEGEASLCSEHKREIELVCVQCDEMICSSCKVESHDTHRSQVITARAELHRKEISDLLRGEILQNRKEMLMARVDRLKTRNNALWKNLSAETASVKEQEQEIRLKTTQAVAKKEQQLKKLYESSIAETRSDLERAESEYRSLNSLVEAARKTSEMESSIGIIKQGPSVIRRLKSDLDKVVDKEEIEDQTVTKVYKKGNIDVDNLEDMIGTVDDFSPRRSEDFQHVAQRQSMRRSTADCRLSSPQLTTKIKLTFVSNVSPARQGKGRPIKGIAPISNNRVWTSFEALKKIYLINQNGALEIRRNLGVVCDDVATNSKEECIVSCPRDKSVRLVALNGDVTIMVKNLDMHPRGLSCRVLADGTEEILMSWTVKSTKRLHVTFGGKNAMGVIMAMKPGQRPEQKTDSKYDYPIRICTAGVDRLCVADYGEKLSVYNTKTSSSETYQVKQKKISPYGVCSSREGYIFTCDAPFDEKESGVYVLFPNNTKEGMELALDVPNRIAYAIAIDAKNVLWVGFSDGQIETYNIS